eukprot:15416922-Alexandrium_andersonii.AAC.1
MGKPKRQRQRSRSPSRRDNPRLSRSTSPSRSPVERAEAAETGQLQMLEDGTDVERDATAEHLEQFEQHEQFDGGC